MTSSVSGEGDVLHETWVLNTMKCMCHNKTKNDYRYNKINDKI